MTNCSSYEGRNKRRPHSGNRQIGDAEAGGHGRLQRGGVGGTLCSRIDALTYDSGSTIARSELSRSIIIIRARPPLLPSPASPRLLVRVYRPAWWLPDGHSATLWGRLGRREPPIEMRVERLATPDGDFLELVRLAGPSDESPRILLLHGLEGGAHSHYARAMFREATTRGWAADLLLFRTCGSHPNRLPRSYHSGETGDPRFIIERLVSDFPRAPLGLVGVSLGGNVLCKLLGEEGDGLPRAVKGAVAMSTPFDLARASRHIGRGFGAVYERRFLQTLVPKALLKIAAHSELAPLATVRHARTLWEFDDRFTAPLHGFLDAADYYARSSSLSFLAGIRRPTLLLSAFDDPFLPADVLNEVVTIADRNDALVIDFPDRGGHVGFTAGLLPWNPWYYGEWRASEFLAEQFGLSHRSTTTTPLTLNPGAMR